ncbi:hypothetical protein N9B20_01205 [Mariniblastus sp.]|nr:hypothetical protein [Mariniblastus sp.]
MNFYRQMSDTEIILIVFGIFYIVECVCWLGKKTVFFAGNGQLRRRLTLWENDRGGWQIMPFTTYSAGFACSSWPVAVSPNGISIDPPPLSTTGKSPALNCDFVPFQKNNSVELHDRSVWLNGQHIVKFNSIVEASEFQRTLVDISSLSAEFRANAIETKLSETTDIAQIKHRIVTYQRKTLKVKYYSTMLFLTVFCFAPLLYFRIVIGPPNSSWACLAVFLIYWISATVSYHNAHRLLYPNHGKERWKQTLLMLASPASAMRVSMRLSVPLLSKFQPIAVAVAIGDRETVVKVAKPILLDLCFPKMSGNSAGSDFENHKLWYRKRLKGRLQSLLQEAGIAPDKLIEGPAPLPDARTYCPRCHYQSVFTEGTCQDCHGILLRSFTHSPGVE